MSRARVGAAAGSCSAADEDVKIVGAQGKLRFWGSDKSGLGETALLAVQQSTSSAPRWQRRLARDRNAAEAHWCGACGVVRSGLVSQ
jgi:hypothetical protein